MAFEEMIEQTLAMLRRHKRLTYRALRRQSNLDEMLHELREELLFQRLAVDEEGKGLVWAAAVPFLAPSLRSPVAPLPEASLPTGSGEASRPVRSTPEAERRQVTVLAFPDGPSRGPRPRRTLKSSASPILLCLSRPRMAAPRLTARRCLVYTALRIIHPWRSR